MRKWLNELRKSQSKTMKTVSKASGVSESYYCQIESGERNCPVLTAKKIAAALGFDWQRFYEDDGKEENGEKQKNDD